MQILQMHFRYYHRSRYPFLNWSISSPSISDAHKSACLKSCIWIGECSCIIAVVITGREPSPSTSNVFRDASVSSIPSQWTDHPHSSEDSYLDYYHHNPNHQKNRCFQISILIHSITPSQFGRVHLHIRQRYKY